MVGLNNGVGNCQPQPGSFPGRLLTRRVGTVKTFKQAWQMLGPRAMRFLLQ